PVATAGCASELSAFMYGRRYKTSVIRSFHEPASAQKIMHQSVESDAVCVLQRNVPLVTRPGFALPPVAGTAPGAGLPQHTALHFFFLRTGHAGQFPVFQSHV